MVAWWWFKHPDQELQGALGYTGVDERFSLIFIGTSKPAPPDVQGRVDWFKD